MLDELLRRTSLGGVERDIAGALLSSPWCWPSSNDELLERTRAYGFAAPKRAEAGESLLVSVDEGLGGAALWTLRPGGADRAERDDDPAEFVERAAEAIVLAERLALRALPFPPPESLRGGWRPLEATTRWRAHYIHAAPPTGVTWLVGPSFGLAMLLGVVSWQSGERLPPDLCALAELEKDGRLRPVGGLRLKFSILRDAALGVRQVFVAHDQKKEAKDLALELGCRFDVDGVHTVAGAVSGALPGLKKCAGSRWRDPSEAKRAAATLFRPLVDDARQLLNWVAVREAAGCVRDALGDVPASDEGRLQAHFVERVSSRHLGADAPIDWPPDAWLAALPRPLRLRVVANLVQSHADSLTVDPEEYCRRAETFLAPSGEQDAVDFLLLGALGRAHAARRRYDLARTHLEHAAAGWHAILRLQDASYSVSELLRVLGVQRTLRATRDEAPVEAQIAHWLPVLEDEPELEEESLGFVRLAAARALVQAGHPEDARAQLEGPRTGVDWFLVSGHLQRGRLRWLARAYAALGDNDTAAAVRKDLAKRFQAPETALSCALADLDSAREAGADLAPHVHRLLRCERNHEVRRLWHEGLPMSVAATRIAEEYRY